MRLKELLENIYQGDIPSTFANSQVPSISCDSRQVIPQSLFVALKGPTLNGADFISDAIKKGATVIVKNEGTLNGFHDSKICVIDVKDTSQFWREIVRNFFGNPSKNVKTVGITGTNGKTTLTYLMESILNAAGQKCGVIGTVNYRIGKKVLPAKNTTPGLLDNQGYLAQLAEEGIKYCAMEVSSHALEQRRVDLIDFAVGVFTNLTGDHLDYHHTMENYFKAKAILFEGLSPAAAAVINVDDSYGCRLAGLTKAKVISYGIKNRADIRAEEIQLKPGETDFLIKFPARELWIHSQLIGEHNVYNILAAVAASDALGIDPAQMKIGVEKLAGIPGRLEQVPCGKNFYVFVDYAHTEDALKNVLVSLKRISRGRVLLVFGCGGDRDQTKRPQMGRVASELADFSFVTSDNPRTENPEVIIDQILKGFAGKNVKVIVDREKAIQAALEEARKEDIVLITGKGHEDYQIFKDKTIHFDDREVVREYLQCSR